VLLACIVSALFWLTYVLTFEAGWGESNWAAFREEIGLGRIWLVIAYTLYSLFWGVVSGIPAAILVWALALRPRDSKAHGSAVAIAGGALALGFTVAFVFSMAWGQSGEEEFGDEDCVIRSECRISE
jgi:hypothetical protein